MKSFKSSRFKWFGVLFATALLCTVMSASIVLTTSALVPCEGEVWGTDAATIDEAVDAAVEVAEQVAREGQVLLKNENSALPMAGDEWVSVLSTSDTSANSSYISGIESGGFKVFNTTEADPSKYSDADKRGHEASDVAIIMVKGVSSAYGDAGGPAGGEGQSTADVGDEEDHKDAAGNPYTYEDGDLFTHKNLPYSEDEEGNKTYFKTSLQLSDTDEEVVKYATDNFDKVIVMLTNGSPSEVGILQANPDIDAILLVGSLGAHGYDEIGKVLNGTVNPSGRTVDLWAWDITGRPTWFNDGNANNIFTSPEEEAAAEIKGMAVTSVFRTGTKDASGHYPYYQRAQHTTADIVPYVYTVMYEEDIYTGYRYYETAAAEASKGNYTGFEYDHEVLYPFGYGLSYTDFEWEVIGTDTEDWGKQQDDYTKDGKMSVTVKVTNTGSVAGKDVVQIYGHAPYYQGGVEKAEHELIGFEKTDLIQPGCSDIVTVTVNIQDLASYDYDNANNNGVSTYELDKVADTDTKGNPLHDSTGHYELRVMRNSHDYGNDNNSVYNAEDNTKGMVVRLTDLTEDIILNEDDFSGSEVGNLFSGDDINNTLSYDPATQKTLVEEGKMTLMSRANFSGTWPAVATEEQLVRSDDYYKMITEFADYNAENWQDYYKLLYPDGTATSDDETEFEWTISKDDFEAMDATLGTKSWTQRSEDANLEELQASDDWLWFSDMVGYDYRDGGEGLAKWNQFMNQLTWQEMVEWIGNGGRRTAAIASVGHQACSYVDATQQMNSSNNFGWGSTYISARTWNKELTYKRGYTVAEIGLLDGVEAYYAPAVNLHRSPFGGRNDEYWSEDGYLSGHLAGNMLAGVQSTGMICTIKHFALNENENMRQSLHTYLSEQTFRELYLPAFQICIQEYGSQGVMTAYNTIGDMHATSAYNFNRKLLEEEWNFDGFNVSDAADPYKDFYTMDMAIRSGLTMLLCDWGTLSTYEQGTGTYEGVTLFVTGEWDDNAQCVKVKNYSADATGATTVASYTNWYHLRMVVMRSLFTEVNSIIGNNGINLSEYKGSTLAPATQGAEYTADIGLEGVSNATYSVSSGELPEGLSISGGQITGTPTGSGDYSFTVTLTSGNFITTSAEYSMTVASAFDMDDTGFEEMSVGEEYLAYIVSDSINTDEGSDYTSLSYALESGSTLPAGLSLDSSTGEISGTPTEGGEFTVTFVITASSSSGSNPGGPSGGPGGSSGGSGGSSDDEYTFTYTFSIAGGTDTPGEPVEEGGVMMRVQDGYIQYSNNGGETWNNLLEVEEDSISMRVQDGYFQYSTDGTTWNNLIAVADLQETDEGGCGGSVVGTVSIVAVCLIMAFVAIAISKRRKSDK
ncbi:MAG TPA: glycoside hydrolase family 3 C-terminal domain-containing protein [Firmicutes bacterium]|nr:glycoside hydrolase family 3 C-terminal domain-containing protein [Bacillota bacterium]